MSEYSVIEYQGVTLMNARPTADPGLTFDSDDESLPISPQQVHSDRDSDNDVDSDEDNQMLSSSYHQAQIYTKVRASKLTFGWMAQKNYTNHVSIMK